MIISLSASLWYLAISVFLQPRTHTCQNYDFMHLVIQERKKHKQKGVAGDAHNSPFRRSK